MKKFILILAVLFTVCSLSAQPKQNPSDTASKPASKPAPETIVKEVYVIDFTDTVKVDGTTYWDIKTKIVKFENNCWVTRIGKAKVIDPKKVEWLGNPIGVFVLAADKKTILGRYIQSF